MFVRVDTPDVSVSMFLIKTEWGPSQGSNRSANLRVQILYTTTHEFAYTSILRRGLASTQPI